MTRHKQYLVALFLGVILAVISVNLEGVVAALPTPWLEHLRHEHRELVFSVVVAIGAVPLIIIGWFGGWVLFRRTNIVPPRLWLLLAAPWAIYALVGPVEYVASSAKITGLFAAGLLVSIASLPIGLWLAALPNRRSVRGAL